MRISRIKIENFKGIKSMELNLEGKNAEIRGANGTGKSTISDAINWLLFGKDSTDAKQFGIRPVNGDKEAATKVTVAFLGGPELTKTLHEKWVKAKGQADEQFKGTETKCDWDGYPCTITEYSKRLAEMFDESAFKLCTSPGAFFKLKWNEQRAFLQEIAGEVSYEDIAKENDAYKEIIAELGNVKMEDYRKKLAKDKKAVKEEMQSIPARIDEILKLRKEEVEDIDKMIAETSHDIEECKKAITANTPKPDKNREKLAEDIIALKQTIAGKEHDAEMARMKKANDISVERIKLERLTADRERIKTDIEIAKSEKADLTKQWAETQKMQFNGETTCPYCGQPLPEDQIAEKIEQANRQKAEKLKAIEEAGFKTKEREKALQERLESATKEIAEKTDLMKRMMDEKEPTADTSTDNARLDKMQKELDAMRPAENTELNRWVDLLNQQTDLLASLKEKAGAREFNGTIDNRIQELRSHNLDLGKRLAELENKEFTAGKLERERVEQIEDKVNAKFKTIRWRMFDFTIEGNPVDTCTATINGVDYHDANTAAKINAGIELINILSKKVGIEAPVIIDKRESVTTLAECDQQVISLVVDANENQIKVTF